MKKIMLLAVALFGATGLCFAQELPEVIPPTPTVANLMQFEEVPVSHYTGQPNIAIPLYSKAINSDLGINIGLSYNTQGIKINNRSGWTGTGWSLNAGGVVSRTVRGIPDEQKRNTGIGGLSVAEGVLHNDDFWNYSNLTQGSEQQQEFLWRAGGTPNDKYDYQPDLFQFSFLGISGRFILVKENGLVVPKLLAKNQNIKVEVNYNTDATSNDHLALNSFTITDTKGYIYTFDLKEVVYSEPFIAIETFDNLQSITGQGQQYVSTNAWHLTKIEMPNSTSGTPLVLATLDYQNSEETYTASVSRTESRPVNYDTTTWNNLMSVAYNASVVKPKKLYSYLSTTSMTQKLSRITFTRDSTYVKFDFEGTSHPETNGDKLGYVRIFDANDVENKHYKFSYITSSPGSRLFLDKIEEVAGSITQEYNLNYQSKDLLPAFDSAHDGWGYHVDYMNTPGSCGFVIPDSTAILSGLLSKIVYPTGGTKEFNFERHRITYQGGTQLTDAQYQDLNPDNWIPLNFDISFNSATDNGTLPEAPLVINQGQTVVYKKISTTATEEEQFNAYIKITGPNNYENIIRLEEDEVHFFLEAGSYDVRFYTPTIGTSYTITGCIGYKNFNSTIKRYVYGGGVRIKNIMFRDSINAIEPERKINFTYDDATGSDRSSGSIDGLITGLRRTHTETVTRHFIPEGCSLPGSATVHSFDFEVTTDGINAELTQGQYVGYKTVDVSETGNGYTRYTFTSAQDQDHHSPAANFIYPYKPAEDLDYKRGLLKKQIVYDTLNRPLVETENFYDTTDVTTLGSTYNHYAQNCQWKQFYHFYDSYKNASNGNGNNLAFVNSGMNLCYSTALQTIDIVESQRIVEPEEGEKYGRVVTTYSFQTNTQQQPCNTDCLQNYTTCNQGTNNVPFYFTSGDIKATWVKVIEIKRKNFYYDINGTVNVKSNRQTFASNETNYQIKQQDSYYNSNGAEEHIQTKYYYPQGTSLNSNSSTIKNALIAQNKVTEVLETESFKNGNKISETHTIYDSFSNILLPKEVHVGKGNITPDVRMEFVNYDTYGNPLEVKKTYGTPVSYIYGFNKSMPVAKVENATYSQIEGVLGSNFNLTGNLSTAQVNSLKNALPNAMITVITYDPIVGIMSMTDPRGNMVTYEYDELNRLKYVKDKDGNIVTENQYHYKN